jgi:hypothetical protein
VWPNIDAYGFLVLLIKRLGTDGVPDLAGRALTGWAWWQSQPQATGNVRAQDEAAEAHADAAPAAPAPASD